MLVLTRGQGDELILDISAIAPGAEPIRVMLVSVGVGGRRARIGIDADPRVAVMRGERVQEEVAK